MAETIHHYCPNCPLEGDCVKIVPCRLEDFVMQARMMKSMPRTTPQIIREAFVRNYNVTDAQADEILKQAGVE